MKGPWKTSIILNMLLCWVSYGNAAKKVLLKDVDVLTLYEGKFTTGRRSSPMPQLECVGGGNAPCSAFKPRVVQCSNRGSDGYDIQWDCKSDMDNAFRFGQIEVSCEGYDYPDDPYILHGSCGLKYSIDYTKEGLHQGSHDYYGNDRTYHAHEKSSFKSYNWIADVIAYAALGVIVYAFYLTCIRSNSNRSEGDNAYSRTNDDYPSDGGSGGYGWFGGGANPTAPPNSGYRDDASCRNRYSGAQASGNSTGGFWTGAATGGLLGYMFGQRQNWGGGSTYRYGPTSGGGGWASSPGYSSGGSYTRSSPSSGTRTASGFGGTSRR